MIAFEISPFPKPVQGLLKGFLVPVPVPWPLICHSCLNWHLWNAHYLCNGSVDAVWGTVMMLCIALSRVNVYALTSSSIVLLSLDLILTSCDCVVFFFFLSALPTSSFEEPVCTLIYAVLLLLPFKRPLYLFTCFFLINIMQTVIFWHGKDEYI